MKNRISPRRIAILGLAALVALTTAGVALAHPHGRQHGPGPQGPGPHGEPGQMLEQLVDRLDLTVAQEDQIREMTQAHRDANRATHESLMEARQALHDTVTAATFDEAAIREAATRVGALETDIAVARAQLMQQIRGVLTPEQLAEFEALQARRQERMEQRRNERRGDGPGRGTR